MVGLAQLLLLVGLSDATPFTAAALQATASSEMAQIDAQYNSVQEATNDAKRYTDLLKANQLLKKRPQSWVTKEKARLRQATLLDQTAQKHREAEITKLHKIQKLIHRAEPAGPHQNTEAHLLTAARQHVQVHMLEASESNDAAKVATDDAHLKHQEKAAAQLMQASQSAKDAKTRISTAVAVAEENDTSQQKKRDVAKLHQDEKLITTDKKALALHNAGPFR